MYLDNSCFECMTLYTFSAFKYVVIAMGENGYNKSHCCTVLCIPATPLPSLLTTLIVSVVTSSDMCLERERAYWHSNYTLSRRQRSSCREWPCKRFICVVILYTLRVLRTNGLQEQSLTNALCCSHWQAAVLWSGMVWPLDFCSAADWKRLKSSVSLWKTRIPWRDGESPVSCRHVISKSLAKQVMPYAQLQ